VSPSGSGSILDALDDLLRALELEPLGDDRFRLTSEPGRFDRVFGGQLVAQALLAAGVTVGGLEPQSLHAYFVQGGVPERSLEAAVDRVRAGRTMATRRITITQDDRTLLIAIASVHTNPESPALEPAQPGTPPPAELPSLQDWARAAPEAIRDRARVWVEQPPPLDVRMGEPPMFLGGEPADGARSHWLRLPRSVGDDGLLHAVLLTYASDYLLLDMAVRNHPEGIRSYESDASSVDHSVWIHRPVRFDQWHLYTQETVAFVGHRGVVRGTLRDEGGALVATVMQEVLLRPRTRPR
jgi:acyl-CoA thioesterase-2